MNLRLLVIPLTLAGCPAPAEMDGSSDSSGAAPSTGETTADAPTTSTDPPTTGDPSSDPSTSGTTTVEPTTSEPTTGEPTTGGPLSDGARVLYAVGGEEFSNVALRVVDDTLPGVPAAPVTVLEAPDGGSLDFLEESPKRTWFVLTGKGGDMSPHLYLIDRVTLDVREVSLPGEAQWVDGVTFTPDEQMLGFVAGTADAIHLFLCDVAPDGTCAPEQWSAPPTMGVPQVRSFNFSSDGTRLAIEGRLAMEDGVRLLLGEVAVPGEMVELAAFGEVFTDVGLMRFAADGDTLYFGVDEQVNAAYEYRAVDVGADPPGPPVPLSPPIMSDVFGRMASDLGALHWWTGEGLRGDLSWIPIAGTTAAPAIVLNSDGPGRVSPRWEWSDDATRVLYLSDHQQPGGDDLYLVDVGGPQPTAPVRVNAPLGPGGEVHRMNFISGGQRAVYFASEADKGDELFIADLAAPESGIKLSGPLPDKGTLQTVAWLSPDETTVAYMGGQDDPMVLDLYMVDLSGPQPAAPLKISPPLPVGDTKGFWSVQYAPDGRRMYIRTPDVDARAQLVRLDVAEPQAVTVLALPEEDVTQHWVLPAG